MCQKFQKSKVMSVKRLQKQGFFSFAKCEAKFPLLAHFTIINCYCEKRYFSSCTEKAPKFQFRQFSWIATKVSLRCLVFYGVNQVRLSVFLFYRLPFSFVSFLRVMSFEGDRWLLQWHLRYQNFL